MKQSVALCTALLMPLLAATAKASTAYISDELVLGVYAEQNGQGQRLTTLHSGASVETLAVTGDFTQVRLSDGTTGWVKTSYLTTRAPATTRVKELEEELERTRAATPGFTAAAAHSELERLKRELAAKQSELDAARVARAMAPPAGTTRAVTVGAPMASGGKKVMVSAVLLALAIGFWLGYATLARHVRQKFGGIKVY